MESKLNYTIVGLFVVLLTFGILGFAYWLAQEGGQEKHDEYRVYMKESVAGLSNDASVKYLGVDVGNVVRMELVPENPAQVLLILRIRQGATIKTDTRAKLKFYGITGLAYIELQGSSKDAPILKRENDRSPVIPSGPSTFIRVDERLSELADKSGRLLDKIDRLLSERNLQTFAELLTETKLLAHQLLEQTGQIQTFVDGGVEMEEHVIQAFSKVESAAASVEKMSNELRKTYVVLGRDLQEDLDTSFTSLNQLLSELDVLIRDMQRTILRFETSPGNFLFKRSRPRPGPGELP